MAACVKHYALNNQELWRGHIDVNLSDRALYEIYLPAFKAAVEEGGAWSIMGAYNKIRGQHAVSLPTGAVPTTPMKLPSTVWILKWVLTPTV